MKNLNIKQIYQFTKEVLKDPWSYLGAILFLYLGFIIFSIMVLNFDLMLLNNPKLFLGFIYQMLFFNITSTFNIYTTSILLIALVIGMITFYGLKNKKHWAWITYFFLLPVKVFCLSILGLNYILLYFSDFCTCPGTTDGNIHCALIQDNPSAITTFAIMNTALVFVYIYLFKKRKKFNIKSQIFDKIFWLLIITYTIFMSYELFHSFTYVPKCG